TGEYQAEQEGTIDFDQTFDGAWFDIEAGDDFDGADLGPFAAGGLLWLMPNNPVGSQAYVTEPAPPVEDSVGAFDPNTGQWHLRDSAGEETSFYFGAPGDVPLAGDWDGDGVDTVGVYRPSNQTVYLRNTNTTGLAEVTF